MCVLNKQTCTQIIYLSNIDIMLANMRKFNVNSKPMYFYTVIKFFKKNEVKLYDIIQII